MDDAGRAFVPDVGALREGSGPGVAASVAGDDVEGSGLLGASLRAGIRSPAVLILLAAGVFDQLAGNPVHFLVLVGTAVALAVSSARSRERVSAGSASGPGVVAALPPESSGAAGASGVAGRTMAGLRSALLRLPASRLAAVGGAFAVLVGRFARYSRPTTVAVVVPCSVAIALSWRGPLRRTRPERLDSVGVTAWVSVFVAAGLWELSNLLMQPSLSVDSHAHPTLSVLSDPFLGTQPGRILALFAWLSLGWKLVRE
jgi:hypothetical protein